MVKYKEYVQKMIDENKELFAAFKKLHDEYAKDQKALQKKYNEEGSKVMDIVREYEDRLCRNTERGQFSTFSGGLSEKFYGELRKLFPMIDYIGLIVSEEPQPALSSDAGFTIRKIDLSN